MDAGVPDSDGARFENYRGLFHPNDRGYEVIACNIEAVYREIHQQSCAVETGNQAGRYLFNGIEVGGTPIDAVAGSTFEIITNNWRSSGIVTAWFHSDPVQLGEFAADGAGEVFVSAAIPDDASPGVHRVVLRGVTEAGQDRTVTFYVRIPGEPTPGELYGLWATGLQPFELAEVNYIGGDYGSIQADQNGNAYLEVLVPDLAVIDDVPVTIVGETSGPIAVATVSATIQCGGLVPTIVGTPGDDTIDGTKGNDVIVGLGGDDVIDGGGGDDVVCGNAGDDLLGGGPGDDVLYGNAGDDTISGGGGRDTLDGGEGDDHLSTKAGDTVVSSPGDEDGEP